MLHATTWAIIIFVLITAWTVNFKPTAIQRVPIVISALTIAAFMAISELMSRRLKWLHKPIIALIADILLVSTVIYFSDGIQSPFYPLYYIVVILAAMDFSFWGALICAGVISAITILVDSIAPGIGTEYKPFGDDVIRTLPYLFWTALITGALQKRVVVIDESASELRAERSAIERGMEVAATIQRAQLPLSTPSLPGIQIATAYRPAREVGGDLYDFYPISKDILGMTIADVSGKGVPAALLVSSTKYAIRESYCADLSEMISAANREILSVTTNETFVTALYGILNIKAREFYYINAGHMPPIVVRAGGDEAICADYSDPALGIAQDSQYTRQHIKLNSGDTLVLYTDGITDALGSSSDGIERLRSFLMQIAVKPITQWADELMALTGEPQHFDDITIVAIKME